MVNVLPDVYICPLRKNSGKMQISLPVLSWWYFSCLHIRINVLLSYELKMFFQIFVFKGYRSVALKNNSLWTVDLIFIEKLQISWRTYVIILTQSEEWEHSQLFSFKNQNNRKQSTCYKFSLNVLKIDFCYFFVFLIYQT